MRPVSSCCGAASPGTPTKTSSFATPSQETSLWIKSLMVKKTPVDSGSACCRFPPRRLLQSRFSLSLRRHDQAAVLAEARVRAEPERAVQQRLHQRRLHRLDEGGGLPQLQEALRDFRPREQRAVPRRPSCRQLQHRHPLQYPCQRLTSCFHSRRG